MGSFTPENEVTWPTFDELPLDPKGPRGNAWGLFGKNDQLGRLNLLTPETVKEACQEIQEGVRVSLDWSLNLPTNPSFARKPMKRGMNSIVHRSVNDETVTFDTQGSTQWDGFRHFGYIDECRYYNGHVQEELETTNILGIQAWVEKGGIVGRGVLLDYAAWADRQGRAYDPMTSIGIPVEDIIAVARESDISFRPGDILFVRTGYTRAYEELSPVEEKKIAQREIPQYIGLEASKEVLRWLWDNKFAAVAGDQPAFEQCPLGAKSDGLYMLHQWCIGGWGMPLGEMFYLEELAQVCQRLNRYTFFVSSIPLKIPGGIASPPNAVAIF
ncbi:hypothetical protein FVEG_09976 [Fusarium verticillioides 7600]|uniref:Cyclase n=1 Tax=Gibberella moniliformis (strain M3125 / FGSC 7600) TaxID=334819 RepID=W7MT24_GIBM7|nr:hypothetical protein FVEG_09976 [Fusarium verticillioides 7600]EWG50845.1 hypothetical protein FVEG_09976 [Fusarium verticillioides 7600]RBQ89232.1 hypothetical protein FVER53263_09976 [Fusarium verticillioides]